MKRLLPLALLLCLVPAICAAQTLSDLIAAQSGDASVVKTTEDNQDTMGSLSLSSAKNADLPNPQLAMSTPGYLVTAGDIYTLAFAAGTTPVTYAIVVDNSYKVRVANLAVINAANTTFLDLKSQVETLVARNYPMSGVQFVLTKPATFKVTVKGEVTATAEPTAWTLTRLSKLVEPYLTPYSSKRDIRITSESGKTATYDLFKATRFGDLSQDPYVRPNDVISVGRIERVVTISGAVERPGSYQLLAGENLQQLIALYGNGLTPLADPSRIALTRYIGSDNVSGNKVYLDQTSIATNYPLNHFDAIEVPEITDLIPVMFAEGAVGINGKTNLDASNRLPVRFNIGEDYASLVRRNIGWFSAVSDTQNAYIIRGEDKIPLNLNPMLYDANYRSRIIVQENDQLMVPFRQYFVTVSGAVVAPGRYPYIPDRDWSYYIALAGGFNPARNANDTVTITDINGKVLPKSAAILPETNVKAENNAFLYYFNQYAPIITTVLSLVSTGLTALAIIYN